MDRLKRVLPADLVDAFLEAVQAAVRKAYDIDAGRYDESVGDDMVTFGIGNYRHVWFHLEEELGELDPQRVSTSRPNGSLAIRIGSRRVRVYRGGVSERLDIHAFDFEEGSLTKASLAEDNQLVLDLAAAAGAPVEEGLDRLAELAIVHAGNPDEGCCALWIGAPRTPAVENGGSTWAWVELVWSIERLDQLGVADRAPTPRPPHTDLVEPEVPLALQDDAGHELGRHQPGSAGQSR